MRCAQKCLMLNINIGQRNIKKNYNTLNCNYYKYSFDKGGEKRGSTCGAQMSNAKLLSSIGYIQFILSRKHKKTVNRSVGKVKMPFSELTQEI
jgi:hypothetical protein